jgi:hypothetical protein
LLLAKSPLQPLNLNTATALEPQQVPGIGPSTARQNPENVQVLWPVQERRRFARDQGIGPKRPKKIREYVTVGKSIAPKKPSDNGAKPLASPPTSKSPPHAPPKTVNQNPPTPEVKQKPGQEREPT